MSSLPKPRDREEIILCAILSGEALNCPVPRTRKEIYLKLIYEQGISGSLTPEQVKAAIDEYIELHPEVLVPQSVIDAIGDTSTFIPEDIDSLTAYCNLLFNSQLDSVSTSADTVTLKYLNGSTRDIDISAIIGNIAAKDLKDVRVDGLIDGQVLQWDSSSKSFVNKVIDTSSVLASAKAYTDQELVKAQSSSAISCDEKPSYTSSTDTVTYLQNGVTKNEVSTTSWFYYRNSSGNAVQTRWISGVEFTIDVGAVNLEDYVNIKNDVVSEYTEQSVDNTKIPDVAYVLAIRDVLLKAISAKAEYETYKLGSGITRLAGDWYSNTRIEGKDSFYRMFLNIVWSDITTSRLVLGKADKAICPADSISQNIVTNNGVPAYVYCDADGTFGVTLANTGELGTDGIRASIMYYSK